MTTVWLDCQTPGDAHEKPASSPPGQAAPPPGQIPGNAPADNAGQLQDPHGLPNPAPVAELPANAIVYVGFQFFKADPLPGQKPTWTRVERTQMHLSQSEFYKMVQKRADKVSAAQQYQNLSDTRRAHVTRLIHEQKKIDPQVEWSCVYAKERDRPSKARNAHRSDYETVSMNIILMKRPMNTRPYPRTPMGDLVDLAQRQTDAAQHFHAHDAMPPPRYPTAPTATGQKDAALGSDPTSAPLSSVVQGPQPRPVSVTSPFTRLELGQSTPAPSEQYGTLRGQTATEKDQPNVDHDEAGYLSETSEAEDGESMIFDESQSDDSSSTEDADHMDCECQEPRSLPTPPRNRSCSPNKHETVSHGAQYRQKSRGRHFGRKDKLRYHYLDILASKNGLGNVMPGRRVRGPGVTATAATSDVKLWEKRYRIQRIDDEELRSRLLDCEARIEQWERAFECQSRLFQQTIEESRQHQLERRRPFWDLPAIHHCGCDCPKNSNMENSD
ncbi:uncharacterized protein N7482_007200 [Penicillium canariense]|uniref:Uncharacterized protein n=1 Tax=Penicillium canariense TaxID=189055 RepID=A0A9W9HYM5_9EURO|nr:uncharacterized protein N7482_007200 [Penicillium canariense]KAJ5160196.1 hypothetical protein N7482_007200 [Penicillium canariense]